VKKILHRQHRVNNNNWNEWLVIFDMIRESCNKTSLSGCLYLTHSVLLSVVVLVAESLQHCCTAVGKWVACSF